MLVGWEQNEDSIKSAKNESFDGSSWTELNDMDSAQYGLGGTGTQTAALGIGGYNGSFRAFTQDWNGVSWAEVADLNTARQPAGEAGTSTLALAVGGALPPDGSSKSNSTEEWSQGKTTKTVDTD